MNITNMTVFYSPPCKTLRQRTSGLNHRHFFFPFMTFLCVLFFSTYTHHTLRSAFISLGAAIGATTCPRIHFGHRVISTHLSCSPKRKTKSKKAEKTSANRLVVTPMTMMIGRICRPIVFYFYSFFVLVLPDRRAGPVSEHPGCNVHRLELLEQELGRIRDVDLRNLGLVLAWPALERLLGKVARRGTLATSQRYRNRELE